MQSQLRRFELTASTLKLEKVNKLRQQKLLRQLFKLLLSGIPLVKLETSGYITYYSDSSGIIAFDELGMLGHSVFFKVSSDGYINSFNLPDSPQAGVLLKTMPGKQATVYLNRTQPAERLFRLTGGGLYRDSVMVGAMSGAMAMWQRLVRTIKF